MALLGEPGVRVEVADGPHRLEAWARVVGNDLVVVVAGGNAPHVGCVVLAQARPSTADPMRTSVSSSVLTIPPHKEEPVARAIAERLAREQGGVVVVSAGIHEDRLGAAGAAAYLRLAASLGERLARVIGERSSRRRSPAEPEPGVM